jgi:flagellin
MPQILNNVSAMTASRQLGVSGKGLSQAIERLTSGKRINRASDDAAGLAQGTQFQAQANQATNAVKGAMNNYYGAQASDAYLQEATNQALRMAELEGSGNTGSAEYSSVAGLVSSVAFLGTTSMTSVSATNSTIALAIINSTRSTLASTMATNQSAANQSGIAAENATSQADTIMAADISAEMVNLTKFQILNQSGVSALTQANQSSQSVLGLFR